MPNVDLRPSEHRNRTVSSRPSPSPRKRSIGSKCGPGCEPRHQALQDFCYVSIGWANITIAFLGLEPTDTENKRENPLARPQSAEESSHGPLLGTILLKSLDKSSQARSSERVCYDSLLRFGAHNSGLSIRRTVKNGPRGFLTMAPRAYSQSHQ